VFYKELKLASFDPGLATNLGFPAGLVNLGLVLFVGAVAVAAFEAVGSILVIAMFICPAAAARPLTRRLSHQIWLSQAFAALSAIAGYYYYVMRLANPLIWPSNSGLFPDREKPAKSSC